VRGVLSMPMTRGGILGGGKPGDTPVRNPPRSGGIPANCPAVLAAQKSLSSYTRVCRTRAGVARNHWAENTSSPRHRRARSYHWNPKSCRSRHRVHLIGVPAIPRGGGALRALMWRGRSARPRRWTAEIRCARQLARDDGHAAHQQDPGPDRLCGIAGKSHASPSPSGMKVLAWTGRQKPIPALNSSASEALLGAEHVVRCISCWNR